MNHAKMLRDAARAFAERPAVSLGETVVADYGTLGARAARLARGLREHLKLAPGDRVALAMTNHVDFLEVLYAIWHAGLAAVPVNAKLHGREFAYILDNAGARVAFATADLMDKIAPLTDEVPGLDRVVEIGGKEHDRLRGGDAMALAEVAPEALAWLFYTSGTTGRPKGATITHRNLTSMVMNYYGDVDSVSPLDCMIHCAPLSHGSGLYALPHVAKAANNIIPESGGYDPAESCRLIGRWPNCTFFYAPTMITRLINSAAVREARLDHLKTIVYGGGPSYVADTLKALDTLGPVLIQLYGQGEAPMTITGLSKAMHLDRTHPRYMERLGSVGIARTDVQVRVVDDNDNELPTGEVGEVVCRGDVVMAGYWQNPEATAAGLRGGWLHTGDVGCFDADGFLTLKDRSKDMIISGGTNIYPREIEEVLLRHAGVLECSVVGRPHADWGEEVVAFVVRRPESQVAEAELDALCLDQIARFKRPKAYRFVDALPKNNYGKILKTELRDMLKKGSP
jgi:acyl-CoA synthetase (AMP-forming)/AMP-acid ligase II